MTRCGATKHGRQCWRAESHGGFHVYARPRVRKVTRVAPDVVARLDGWCEARTVVCSGRATQVHHLLRRSQGGSDEPENLCAVCAGCHEYVHRNPEWAYRVGLLHRSSSA